MKRIERSRDSREGEASSEVIGSLAFCKKVETVETGDVSVDGERKRK